MTLSAQQLNWLSEAETAYKKGKGNIFIVWKKEEGKGSIYDKMASMVPLPALTDLSRALLLAGEQRTYVRI